MNKIEKLIQELCPNGVEFKELGNVCKIETGKHNANASVKDGKYLFFTTAKEASRIDIYRWDTEAIMIAGNANVGDVKHYIGKFDAYQRTYVLTNFIINLNPRFLYFVLKNNLQDYLQNNKNEAAMTYIVLSTLQKFQIPIPPIEIQEEIVKILDSFTELEAELEAELEKRREQYVFFRDELLTFDGENKNPILKKFEEKVEWKSLGEIGKVSMCKRIFKDQTSDIGEIPFYKIGTFGKEADSFISKEIYEDYRSKYSFPKIGDILLSASGTIGKRVIYDGKPAYFQDSNIVWIDNDETQVLNKFLYHFYAIVDWKTDGGSIQRLYNSSLQKIQIPIPNKEVQERIVYVLDNFEKICNDFEIGLPAEIEARKKQYEYYRERLLSFDKLGNTHTHTHTLQLD